MDEDYARKLRAWLSAEPNRAEEEREWLREVPAPQEDPDRWTVRGRLPREPVEELEEEWVCPVIALPVPRASEENGCRMSGPDERRTRNRRLSADQTGERPRRLPGEGAADRLGMTDPAGRSRNRRLPADRPGASEAAERRPEIRHPRGEAAANPPANPPGMSEAEARSRWNHPSNWHRRRRAEGRPDPDQPGSH